MKSGSGGSNRVDKEDADFVSFKGEQPKFKHYMYVEFKVQIEKQKGKKTKAFSKILLEKALPLLGRAWLRANQIFPLSLKKNQILLPR